MLFSSEEYAGCGNTFVMPKVRRSLYQEPVEDTPENVSRMESLSAIMSREWLEEAEVNSELA